MAGRSTSVEGRSDQRVYNMCIFSLSFNNTSTIIPAKIPLLYQVKATLNALLSLVDARRMAKKRKMEVKELFTV